jgi:hypothetical protein
MSRFAGVDRLVAGRARKAIVAVAVLALIAIPISNGLASHQFIDVPTTSPYHPAISAIREAEITGGCSQTPPKYCPRSYVTREQMAVFLDRIGNLRNEHGPVTDALTLLGQLMFADVEDFNLSDNAAHECETSSNVDLPSVPDDVVSYSIVHQLFAAPIQTDLVNVQINDPDQTDGTYQVCFRTVDGSNLTPGLYRTNYWIAVSIGSGIFGGAGAGAEKASRFRSSFKH